MTRKIICTFLTLLLCLSLAVPAFAQAKDIDFVVDEFDYLAAEELYALNEQARSIYEKTGVGIFYVFTQAGLLRDYDISSLTGGMEDFFVMMENDTSWYTFKGGLGETIDAAAEDKLRAVYDAEDTYVSGVENFLYAAAEYFPEVADPSPKAEENLLFDAADLLTDSEEAALTQKLMEVSHTCDAQIVVVTSESTNGVSIDHLVDHVYDSMGFGYGDNRDGILLLICMDVREYRILSNGYPGVAVSEREIDEICDAIVSDLSDGDYAEAFHKFADRCEYYLDGYRNGYPFNAVENLAICLIIGIVAGVVVALILKGQLKTVRSQNRAHDYVRPGSMQLTVRRDLYLYRNVTRTKKESSSSSGSSGGSSRSRGGGSF